MCKKTHILPRWLPAVMMMTIIFMLSSQPADELPSFGLADLMVKKGGHIIGYATLAWLYWYALGMQAGKRWLAWLFTVLYALTDELHQFFVPGRSASVWDVLIFDNLGALISLWFAGIHTKGN